MRPVYTTLGAAGNGPWIPVNELQNNFQIGIGVYITSGAVLTYGVQHSFDEPTAEARKRVTIARAGTVATLTYVDPDAAGHQLSVGDSMVITGSGSSNLDGTYDVATVVDANNVTYTVVNTGAAASVGETFGTFLRVWPHATLTGLSARADGNYAFPVQAVRLRVTAYTSGKVTMNLLQGMGR